MDVGPVTNIVNISTVQFTFSFRQQRILPGQTWSGTATYIFFVEFEFRCMYLQVRFLGITGTLYEYMKTMIDTVWL